MNPIESAMIGSDQHVSNNAGAESQSNPDTHNLDGGANDDSSGTHDGADYANNDGFDSGGFGGFDGGGGFDSF